MKKKYDLLKELGWNEQLIKHFMIEDSEFNEDVDEELVTEILDTNTMTITFSAENENLTFYQKGFAKNNYLFGRTEK